MLIGGATVVTVNDRDDILDPGWIALREAVVVDGATVVEQGKVATTDEREILAGAGSQLTLLLGS